MIACCRQHAAVALHSTSKSVIWLFNIFSSIGTQRNFLSWQSTVISDYAFETLIALKKAYATAFKAWGQLYAITDVRTQMTQRGKILIVALDDKTAVHEVTVYSEVFEANKNAFKEDEFLLVVGKVSEDRFNGGLRITAEKVFDLATSRIQYGHKLEMDLATSVDPAKIAEVLQPYRVADGMPVSLRLLTNGIPYVVQLGDDWRVGPSDSLKQALELTLGAKDVAVEY